MELFIIRHAQSHNNTLQGQTVRVVDPPLTELGLRQAQLVAQHIATAVDTDHGSGIAPPGTHGGHGPLGISRLYCSAMLRALETAQAIGRAIAVSPAVWVDIHEEGGMWLDHGAERGIIGYPGMTRGEIARRFPECALPPEITEQGWWRTGQEEPSAFQTRARRVAAALHEMAARTPDDRIAIVTHGGFGAALIKAIFNVPFDAPFFFYHNNTGISRVRYRADGRISLRYQNRVGHLPPELVS